jgi:hypothetical protein
MPPQQPDPLRDLFDELAHQDYERAMAMNDVEHAPPVRDAREEAEQLEAQRDARAWTVARNIAAIGAGWVLVSLLATTGDALSVGWLARKAIDPLGLSLAALLAHRVRARWAMIICSGLAVSQGVEATLDALRGEPAVHGFSAHMTLIAAGLAASVFVFTRRDQNRTPRYPTPPLITPLP